jgi:hypothetical protein
MATQDYSKYHIDPVWDQSYKQLKYVKEPFNDIAQIQQWMAQGYSAQTPFTGDMCDMRRPQPVWNEYFLGYFSQRGWRDIGTSYYRMATGTILPVHIDTYRRYIELFKLQGKESSVRRALVFLEDWQSGHYFEINGQALTGWLAGDVVEWDYNVPHMAANIGVEPRYTLQITGHI